LLQIYIAFFNTKEVRVFHACSVQVLRMILKTGSGNFSTSAVTDWAMLWRHIIFLLKV